MRDSEAIHHLINGVRKKHGLTPLTWNRDLYVKAKIHTKLMANNARIFHSGGKDITGEVDLGSENVLMGPRNMTTRQMVASWMDSPGHRRWILDPKIKYSATAIIRTNTASYATWWYDWQPVSKIKQLLKISAVVLSPLILFGLIKLLSSA